VFFINIPIALLVLALTPRSLPGGRMDATGGVDIVGAITVTAGLAAAVYAVVRAPEIGWGAAATWWWLLAAAVLLALFVIVQAKTGHPLMRLGIFRTPNLAAANLAQFPLAAAWVPMWFFLNLYLQQVLGYTAFPSGAALLPMTALIMIGMIALAPKVLAALGTRNSIVLGLALLAGGLAWLAQISPNGNYGADVLFPSLLAALGMSLAFIPSLGAAISSAPPQDGGLAAGIVNTNYQVGSALGLAAMTAIAAANGSDQLGNPTALTGGFSAAFWGAAAVAATGALLTLMFMKRQPASRNGVVASKDAANADPAATRAD